MTVLQVLRYAMGVVYLGMAIYLMLASTRRLYLVATGVQPADPGPYAAFGIGLSALVLLAVYLLLRRHGTRKRLPAERAITYPEGETPPPAERAPST